MAKNEHSWRELGKIFADTPVKPVLLPNSYGIKIVPYRHGQWINPFFAGLASILPGYVPLTFC
ncbi:hypothetical protein [Beijerinckia indica]|uniref:hypothetical protein n=1 Tax=Beijerinckia indica TaxID=533 RepID=UPI0011D0C107|nr:hypothetical protein [Beijerinckia indica]